MSELPTSIASIETLRSRDAVFVKIETADGQLGYGEATGFFPNAVVGMIDELRPYLVGQDARRIEHLWQESFRRPFQRGGPVMGSAIAGIDLALWDIKGKALGVPVYELLGGLARDKVRVYGHVVGGTAADAAVNARALVAKGVTAIRFRALHDYDARRMHDHELAIRQQIEYTEAIRDAVGRDVDLILECHGRYDPVMALRLAKQVERFDLFFLEDPVRPENPEAFRELRRHTSVPIGTGERGHNKWDFRELVVGGLVDYLRPDVCWAGGLTEVRKIAALAELYYVQLVPHNIQGPLGSTATIHAALSISNVAMMEDSHAGEEHPEVEASPWPQVVDGYALPPSAPGLGITFDESRISPPSDPGRYPAVRALDGSVRDW